MQRIILKLKREKQTDENNEKAEIQTDRSLSIKI